MSADFHKLAKDAGNKLRSYILAYASGATGVFFLALAGKNSIPFSQSDKMLLLSALFLYVFTVVICLIELHVDARRFFSVATQLEKPEPERNWTLNERYKKNRLHLIFGSYVTAGLATILVMIFLILRIA